MMRRFSMVVAGLSLLILPAIAGAQALADRVPADAIVYFGWRGAADLGPGYDGSHLKVILEQSQLPKLLHESIPAFIKRIESVYPQAAPFLDMGVSIEAPLWTHPSALYVGPFDLTDKNHPKPHIALLCDAGADAANMVASLNTLIAQIPPGAPFQIIVKQFDTLVVVSTYDFAEHPDAALAADTSFTAALAKVDKDPITTVYLSGERLSQQIDAAVDAAGDAQGQTLWPKIRDAIGLPGIKRLILTDGFDGKDWSSQGFVEAPAPRHGLAILFDAHALSDDILKDIPDSATLAGAGQFDLAKILAEVRTSAAQIDPSAGQMLDSGIEQANEMLGFDVNKDLLSAFGDEWGYYIDPNVAGTGSLGMVLINRCRDAQKLDSSLTSLEKMANQAIAAFTSRISPLMTVEFKTEQIDGLTVHYAALPIFTPAWTIKDGVWYLGMYPQIVVSAANRPAGKSILDNPDYQAFRKRIGGPDAIAGVAFLNLPLVADQGYQGLLSFTRLFVGAGDLFGLDSPAMVIPTLDKIKPELEPEGMITWVDDDGWHMKSICAFPGDELLGMDNNAAALIVQCFSLLGTMAPHATEMRMAEPAPMPPPSPGL